ncbi:MAG: hypothetical protein K0R29_1539 [Pseudobdellovibrio sp.]|nr:hypothetical protein [Pseudobdellovibrio sp.]
MFNLLTFIFLLPAFAETTFRLENYFNYTNSTVAETFVNPGNQILQLPSETLGADIRAEAKWRGEKNQVIVRPRYQAERFRTEVAGMSSEKSESDWDITDAFWESQFNEDVSITAGLQVYQWGPAELLNPSNPLFHFNSRQKSYGYKEKGLMLLRVNYTIGKLDNFVFIAEPAANNEPGWMEGEFTPKALIKYEHQSEETASQFGIVAGQEEKEKKFLGTYFTWQVTEAASFYADAKTTEEEIGYKPVSAGPFYNLISPTEQNEWPVLSVTGLRWEGDFDIRAEYIYNSAGYTEVEWQNVLNSVANPLNPEYLNNFRNFQKSGLELPGKQYLYISYRVTEPFTYTDLNIYLRHLYSLQDYSSQVQFEFDKAIGDAWVFRRSFP